MSHHVQQQASTSADMTNRPPPSRSPTLKGNWKLVVDPLITKGEKNRVFRLEGSVINSSSSFSHFNLRPDMKLTDPRSHIPRFRHMTNALELPVPSFTIDSEFVGEIPARQISFFDLNDNINEKFLKELCQQIGKVTRVRVLLHPRTRKHMGIGYVHFQKIKDAKRCAQQYNGKTIMGGRVSAVIDVDGHSYNEVKETKLTTRAPAPAQSPSPPPPPPPPPKSIVHKPKREATNSSSPPPDPAPPQTQATLPHHINADTQQQRYNTIQSYPVRAPQLQPAIQAHPVPVQAPVQLETPAQTYWMQIQPENIVMMDTQHAQPTNPVHVPVNISIQPVPLVPAQSTLMDHQAPDRAPSVASSRGMSSVHDQSYSTKASFTPDKSYEQDRYEQRDRRSGEKDRHRQGDRPGSRYSQHSNGSGRGYYDAPRDRGRDRDRPYRDRHSRGHHYDRHRDTQHGYSHGQRADRRYDNTSSVSGRSRSPRRHAGNYGRSYGPVPVSPIRPSTRADTDTPPTHAQPIHSAHSHAVSVSVASTDMQQVSDDSPEQERASSAKVPTPVPPPYYEGTAPSPVPPPYYEGTAAPSPVPPPYYEGTAAPSPVPPPVARLANTPPPDFHNANYSSRPQSALSERANVEGTPNISVDARITNMLANAPHELGVDPATIPKPVQPAQAPVRPRSILKHTTQKAHPQHKPQYSRTVHPHSSQQMRYAHVVAQFNSAIANQQQQQQYYAQATQHMNMNMQQHYHQHYAPAFWGGTPYVPSVTAAMPSYMNTPSTYSMHQPQHSQLQYPSAQYGYPQAHCVQSIEPVRVLVPPPAPVVPVVEVPRSPNSVAKAATKLLVEDLARNLEEPLHNRCVAKVIYKSLDLIKEQKAQNIFESIKKEVERKRANGEVTGAGPAVRSYQVYDPSNSLKNSMPAMRSFRRPDPARTEKRHSYPEGRSSSSLDTPADKEFSLRAHSSLAHTNYVDQRQTSRSRSVSPDRESSQSSSTSSSSESESEMEEDKQQSTAPTSATDQDTDCERDEQMGEEHKDNGTPLVVRTDLDMDTTDVMRLSNVSPFSVIKYDHCYCLHPDGYVVDEDTGDKVVERDVHEPVVKAALLGASAGTKRVLVMHPQPAPSRRTFKPRPEQVQLNMLHGIDGRNRFDEEDRRFLQRVYNDDAWCSRTKVPLSGVYRAKTPPPSPPQSPCKKTRSQDGQPKTKHSKGCARAEGYYKVNPLEKMKLGRKIRQTQLTFERTPLQSQQDIDDAKKQAKQHREVRTVSRHLQSSGTLQDCDLLKMNQLITRKKLIKFSRSHIHGWGLFALETIEPDQMIIEYVGEIIRLTVCEHREVRYEKQGIGSSYLFRIDNVNAIDATKRGSVSRFINHSCQPSCYAKIIIVEGEQRIVIYAKQQIHAGEEITYDYKFPIEEKEKKIPCLCGTAGCRKFLN